MGKTVDVLVCTDCADLERIDPAKLLLRTSAPCDCGCGWSRLLCQVCGKSIGHATALGTIDLGKIGE